MTDKEYDLIIVICEDLFSDIIFFIMDISRVYGGFFKVGRIVYIFGYERKGE